MSVTRAKRSTVAPIDYVMKPVETVRFPLVFACGPGAGARNSIGIMLVTGMIIGTLFTLFIVPSIYVLLARTRRPAEAVRTEEEEMDADFEPSPV